MTIQRYDLVLDPIGECACCCVASPDGKYVLFEDHTAAMAAKDAEIAMLKDCLENGNCIHCGELVSDLDVDHWRKCPKHPANAEIARLRKVVEAVKRWKVAYNEHDIREARDAVSDALSELDGAK